MKRGFECIYGYGIDEYFVLARLSFLTGFLVLVIIILNGVDVLSGIFSSWSLVIESCISCVFICIYAIQLRKYKSAFGFQEVVVPFVSSCIGLLITSMFVWHSRMFSILFLFFTYCFIICVKEIMSIAKTLEWGDHAIVRVGNRSLDSSGYQFYLIFFSKSKVTTVLRENRHFRFRQVDEVVRIEQLPKASDGVDGWRDFTPIWRKVVEWFMGLRIFR